MALTICNSISLHCFRLMRDWKLESFANGKEICAVPFTGAPSSNYVVYATACVYRELCGKITDRKKSYVNNYLI